MDASLLGTSVAGRAPRQRDFPLRNRLNSSDGVRELLSALRIGRFQQAIVCESDHEAVASRNQLGKQREVVRFPIHDVDDTRALDPQRPNGLHLAPPSSPLVFQVVLRLRLLPFLLALTNAMRQSED